MIGWAMRQIVQHPDARYCGRELRFLFSEQDLRASQDEGLLQLVSSEPPASMFHRGVGRVLTIENRDGEVIGYDDEDPEFDPVLLRPADWAQFQFEPLAIARRFAQASHFRGPQQRLGQRFVLVSRETQHGRHVPVVLALLPTTRLAMDLLPGLPALLPMPRDRIGVVTPFLHLSTSERLALASMCISIVGPLRDLDFRIELSAGIERKTEDGELSWIVTLTEGEEEAFARAKFQSRLPIYIAGQDKRQYCVYVAGQLVRLPHTACLVFLRALVGLLENEDGWVSEDDLRTVRVGSAFYETAPNDVAAAWSRLKTRFPPAAEELFESDVPMGRPRKPKRLVAKPGQHAGRRRLSTHPKYIRWEQQAIEEDDSAPVRMLAARLKPFAEMTTGS